MNNFWLGIVVGALLGIVLAVGWIIALAITIKDEANENDERKGEKSCQS